MPVHTPVGADTGPAVTAAGTSSGEDPRDEDFARDEGVQRLARTRRTHLTEQRSRQIAVEDARAGATRGGLAQYTRHERRASGMAFELTVRDVGAEPGRVREGAGAP